MIERYRPIRELLDRTRARWRLVRLFEGAARGSSVAALFLAIGVALTRWTDHSPLGFITIVAASVLLVVAALVWGIAPTRHSPSDRRVARFIEEREPTFDDRLVSAVDLASADNMQAGSALAAPMVADAARRARDVDLDVVLPRRSVHRAGLRAAGGGCLLLVVGVFAWGPARRSIDAASLLLFPERLRLTVEPGSTRIAAGVPLSITARLSGSRAPVNVRLQIEDGERSRSVDMAMASTGEYRFALDSVTSPFKYRATAGAVASATYDISVVTPPRVARVDLEFSYPASLGLKTRLEQDSGDIYGPAGTRVRVLVHADRPAASGVMTLGNGERRTLISDDPKLLSTMLTIATDDSYRLSLIDRDGVSSPGDTEYFIRAVDDRPPEVHVTKPAADRSVTSLEEVDIEVQAIDDYGVDRLDLVYAVRGGSERSVPLDVPRGASSVTGRQTLYLEDLKLQPGDFVSYYARARDRSAGRRANEVRSDIFFLDVRPYEQEFSLAASQSMAGSGYSGTLDELVNIQRQVVVATWKLTRRAEGAKAARSERDIRSVAETESNLQALVQQAASSFHESTMRDPRERGPVGGAARGPEDETMAAAADAMGKAVAALDALDTGAALGPEMHALNLLLKAQAEIKRRQISANQSAAAAAGNTNRNYDISTLFDRELQRPQTTNYETSSSARASKASDVIDRLRDLAKRQDELLRREQSVSSKPMSQEERRRELERLTREQMELRQQADQLARQVADPRSTRDDKASNTRGPAGQQGQTSRGGGEVSHESDLREVSEAMRQAAGDLRRGAPEDAGAKSARALDMLRNLERRLESARRDDRGRAVGDEDSRRLSEQLARAQELRDRLNEIGRALESAGRQGGRSGRNSQQKAPGESGRIGAGRRGAGGIDTTELREQSLRPLQEAQKLLDDMRRQDPSFSRNGAGFTFEGQGLVLSAPGTEAFKQDLSRWELLKRQATTALEQAEALLAQRLQTRALKDRLPAGFEEKAPSEYQTQVAEYFKALAQKK